MPPEQINLQVPFGLPAGVAALVIGGNAQSVTRPVHVESLRPGIFAVVHAADFSPATAHHPATPGEYLAIFATGLGSTDPSVPAGEMSPAGGAPLTTNATMVVPGAGPIGGGPIALPSYAGLAPGMIGVYQVNFQLTADVDPGVSGLFVIIGGGFQTDMVPLYVKENPAEGLPPTKLRRRNARSIVSR